MGFFWINHKRLDWPIRDSMGFFWINCKMFQRYLIETPWDFPAFCFEHTCKEEWIQPDEPEEYKGAIIPIWGIPPKIACPPNSNMIHREGRGYHYLWSDRKVQSNMNFPLGVIPVPLCCTSYVLDPATLNLPIDHLVTFGILSWHQYIVNLVSDCPTKAPLIPLQ